MRPHLTIYQAHAWAVFGTEAAVDLYGKPSTYREAGLGAPASAGGPPRHADWAKRRDVLREALASGELEAFGTDRLGNTDRVKPFLWARHDYHPGGFRDVYVHRDQLLDVLPRKQGGTGTLRYDWSEQKLWWAKIINEAPSISLNEQVRRLQGSYDAAHGMKKRENGDRYSDAPSRAQLMRKIAKWAEQPIEAPPVEPSAAPRNATVVTILHSQPLPPEGGPSDGSAA